MVASIEYLKAADYYPVDDEKHACESPISDTFICRTSTHPRLILNNYSLGYLHMAFDTPSQMGGHLDHLLMVLNRLHDSLSRMKQIWEAIIAPKVDVCEDFAADLKYREQLLRLAKGKSKEEFSRIISLRMPK